MVCAAYWRIPGLLSIIKNAEISTIFVVVHANPLLLAFGRSARYNTLTLHIKVFIAHMKKDKHTLNISLLADRVLILPQDKKGEQKTASGIILQKKDGEQKVETGTVVAVGNGRRNNEGERVALDVKVGDTVYFKRGYDVDEITIDAIDYVLASEMNVYAILN